MPPPFVGRDPHFCVTPDDHVAVRSENNRTADHAQADRRLHHVGRNALRAFAHQWTTLTSVPGLDVDSLDVENLGELPKTQNGAHFFATPLASPYSKRLEQFDTSIFIVGKGKHMQNQKSAVQQNRALAKKAGEFLIGGDLHVARLGFGAMRITGEGVWGEPEDRAEAVRVLRRAVELGINFIDTADSYGPHVSEEIIAEALHPYPEGLVIATKGGFDRPGPRPMGGKWKAGTPEIRLRRQPAAVAPGAD